MTEAFIERFTYLGIALTLVAGGLGLPIPEEVPIVSGGVLAQQGVIRWWVALPLCFVSALAADVVLYWAGRRWGTRILGWRPARLVLTPARLDSLTDAYRRHGVKIVVTARHLIGIRPAAFLTAGAFGLPFWRFLIADALSALVTVPLGFAIAYLFATQVVAVVQGVHRVERWLLLLALVVAAAVLGVRAWRRLRRG